MWSRNDSGFQTVVACTNIQTDFTAGSCTIMTGAPGFNYCLNIYTYEVLNFLKCVLLHEFWWDLTIFIASPDVSNTSNQAEQLFMKQNNQIYKILSAICDNYVYYYFMSDSKCDNYTSTSYLYLLKTVQNPNHKWYTWINVGNTDIPKSVILYVPVCMHICMPSSINFN